MNLRNRQILNIALPSILSNVTVPLLSLIDLAIVGHLGNANYIGAIAVGGMMFNLIYWVFGFLRMGTGGLTSQAYGRRDFSQVVRLLGQSLVVSVVIGILLLLLSPAIKELSYLIIQPSAEIKVLSARYFSICIWGAPAVLGLYSLTGWYVGMQNTRTPLLVAVTQNLVNIAASLFFVYLLHLKIEGIALGTLVAQYVGLFMGLWLWRRNYSRLRKYHERPLLRKADILRFFSVNGDIFLRTLCLIAVTLYFTAAGARQGELILAVNTLMMQLFTLYSYVMDGFAYAGEALAGRFIGSRHRDAFDDTVRRLFLWGLLVAVAFTLTYAVAGQAFIGLLTDQQEVVNESRTYLLWTLLIPACGGAAFIWDGIFIGATATRQMLCSMAVATCLFFLNYHLLIGPWGNHGLWVAFLSYLLVRGAVQTMLFPSVRGKSFLNTGK